VWTEFLPRHKHVPAINNGDIGLLILTDNAQSVSLEIGSGPHHWRWCHYRPGLLGVIPGCVRILINRGRLFSLATCLLFPEALFLHHCVLTSNNLFFASMYRGLSRALLTFVPEEGVHALNKVALLKQ